MNGIVITEVTGIIGNTPSDEISLDKKLVASVFLSQIINYNKLFSKKYGRATICLDAYGDGGYWRKKEFEYYKTGRKKAQKKATFDWELFFKLYNIVRDELKDLLPNTWLCVDGCEADDSIAVLSKLITNPCMIVSSDKDLIQLQHGNPHIEQYSPRTKKRLKLSDYDLLDHILRGDRSDGIPNIRSGDDFLVEGIRQKPITKKIIEGILEAGSPEEYYADDPEILKNIKRNKLLIDLNNIPQEYKDLIKRELTNQLQKNHDMKSLREWAISNKLDLLFDKLDQL